MKGMSGASLPRWVDDLRGGASLLLAGLAAEGFTRLSGAELLGRGYDELHVKLASLGAIIVVE